MTPVGGYARVLATTPDAPAVGLCRCGHAVRREPQHHGRAGHVHGDPARVGPPPGLGVSVRGVEALGKGQRLARDHVHAIGRGGERALAGAVPEAHLAPEDERVGAVRRAQELLAHVRGGSLDPELQASRRGHRRRVPVDRAEQVAQGDEGRPGGEVVAQEPERVLGLAEVLADPLGFGERIGELVEVRALDAVAEGLEHDARAVRGVHRLGHSRWGSSVVVSAW